jgi:hypothetical protein
VTFVTVATGVTAASSHFESAKVPKKYALFDETRTPFPQYDSDRSDPLDKASTSGSNLASQTKSRP